MTKPAIEILPLDTFRPQAANANAHTARGEGALRDSIQTDGFIDAATVAADGEHISGSSRYEQALATGFDTAIVVHSDGTRPVIVVRDDIPTAEDARAKRLALAANRVAELNLEWDSDVLAALQAEDAALLAGLWREGELPEPPDEAEWETALGGLPTGDKAPFQQMTFTVSDDQAATINDALRRAKAQGPFVATGNENSNGNALARICEAFGG